MDSVGVDFGTATTLVAEPSAWGPPVVLPIGRATRAMPSLARATGGRLLAGEEAEDAEPERVIRSVKGAITQRRTTVTVGGSTPPPWDASEPAPPEEVDADAAMAAILTELAERSARAGLPLRERRVRLGCPALWDGAQRRRLAGIAARAGLAVGGLVDEPVAAGLAWLADRFLGHGERPTGRLLVFDMGGGTLDLAVLAVAGGPSPDVRVQASLGIALAGDALDVAIARDLAAEMAGNRIDVTLHPQPDLAWALLERAAREAKVRLSLAREHPVVLPRPLGYPHPIRYTRERLEAAFAPQLDGAENLVIAALRAARMSRPGLDAAALRGLSRDELRADVDFVLLCGGCGRIPAVRERLAALFPKALLYEDAGVGPDEAVVAGLAAGGHERIGLHRPGHDLVLEWDAGRRRYTLYDAYTPLYEPWQVYNGHSDLGYEQRVRPPAVPEHGEGWLRVLGPAGAPLRLWLDGQEVAGLPVRFGPAETILRVYSDGRVYLRDGAGRPSLVRAERWPAPRSSPGAAPGDSPELALRRMSEPSPTVLT